jgi:hypothetical protein
MTSIMTTQNISSLFSRSLSLSQATEYDYYDLEPTYSYCDASGNPYLDTIIPSKLSYVLLDQNELEDEPIILDLSDDNRTMLTDLSNPNDRCPMRFMNTGVSWGSAVDAYANELAEIKKTDDLVEFTEFNKKNEEDVLREIHELKLASLPKFPKAMLERMKKEAEELSKLKPNASSEFYTWKVGAKASNTSHTAWGHRRSGGGKGKTLQTLSEMNSEKSIAILAAKKRLRQQANKEKAEVEAYRRAEKMKTLEVQKIAYKAVEHVVVEPIVVEETDFQKFRREEMEAFNTKASPQIEYIVETKVLKSENKELKWNKVDAKQTKSEKLASTIIVSLFTKPSTKSRTGAFNKLAVSNGGELRSRLCKSVMTGGLKKCPHGIRCKFAHTPVELNVTGCVFGDRCKFVTKGISSWENAKVKICQFGHPGEETDKASFCKRIGMVVVCNDVSESPPVVKTRSNHVHSETQSLVRPSLSYSSVVMPSLPVVVEKRVRPSLSYSSAVSPEQVISLPVVIQKQAPRVFKIHIDQLGRTTAYIISMKLTNVVIEFI